MRCIVDQAAELAAAGVPVFPLREDKRPTTPHGFKDAVHDPAAVPTLWRRHSGTLIGVPTGEASGLDALDIDPRHGGHLWWAQYGSVLPQSRIHRTRSGGLHALFRHAPGVRNTESKIARGVDTRGEGGYIVWWPAAGLPVSEYPIIDWPTWLLEALFAGVQRLERQVRPIRALDSADHAQRVAQRVFQRVERASAGERYYALRKGAYALGGLLEYLPFGGDEAIERLVQAAEKAGGEDLRHARRIAEWGLRHGKDNPFILRRMG